MSNSDQTSAVSQLDSHIRDDTIDIMVAQRILLDDASPERPASFAVLSGGMRYRNLDMRTSNKPGVSASERHNWIEPVVGAAITLPTSQELSFSVGGDMSGFDIGSGSHRTWTADASAAYKLDVSNTIRLGWRIWDVTLARGSGANRYEFDGSFSGPYLGWIFAF